eukprot:2916528-Pyramimonas_sp.AAC.1
MSRKVLKTPTECALLERISWMRQMMGRGIVHSAQSCDTRAMTADGHAEGNIDRDMRSQVMGGAQSFKRDLTRRTPYRADQTNSPEAARGAIACQAICLQGNLFARALARAGQPSF